MLARIPEEKSSFSFFGSISKNLTFEADETKNTKNEKDASQQDDNTSEDDKDASLDSSLDELKQQKEEEKNGSNNDADSSSGSDTGSEEGDSEDSEPDMSDGSAPATDSDVGGDTTDDSSVQSDDTSSSADTTPPAGSKSSNRKLILYTEFNRVYNALKESVVSLAATQTIDDKIKSCVAQLQDISNDTRHVMSIFDSYSDTDLMVHLQLIKERTSLIMEQLNRMKNK